MSKANLKMAETKTTGRRKISVRSEKLSEKPEGFSFRGIYRGTVLGAAYQDVNQKTGELVTKQLQSVVTEDHQGERTAWLADKGLLDAINTGMVKEGDAIEVVKLQKRQISKGRTMNQYDLFALDSLNA